MKHILGFSGGIDSQAVYCWLADRYPVEDIILLHSNAGGNDVYFDCYVNHPLAEWSKIRCFDFVKVQHGQEINPLYTMGFPRVGCMPCINASKEEIRQIADRFPEIIDRLREWEKRVGRTYFAPVLPGGQYGSIDEIVEWAKTDRGGRQYNLFRQIADRPNCQSKYGLCE